MEQWEAMQSYRAVFMLIRCVLFVWTVEWGMAQAHGHHSLSTTLWSESSFYLPNNFEVVRNVN